MSPPERIEDLARTLAAEIAALPLIERVDALNRARLVLSEASPFRAEPVDCVQWVPAEQVAANDYNPNKVAPPEMRLLEHSIREDGYTQPIVAYRQKSGYTVVDGFHRNRVGKEASDIRERIHGHLPLALINEGRGETKDRMAATVRHNRARGVHAITPMAELVAQCYFNGWSNKRICKEFGMEKDEVLRLKQFTGIGTLFENRGFSSAWELETLIDRSEGRSDADTDEDPGELAEDEVEIGEIP